MIEDPDRRRALELTTKSTSRILSAEEVMDLRDYVLKTDMSLHGNRGTALAMVQKIDNGMVLSQPEAAAIALGFETKGEPWFHRFRAIHEDDGTVQGVLDPSLHKKYQDPTACPCNKSQCVEHNVCQFISEHNYVKSGLVQKKRKDDCGCSA